MKIPATSITVRWHDGFKRTYSIKEYEPGSDHLWIKETSDNELWIPTRSVRWFSPENNDYIHTHTFTTEPTENINYNISEDEMYKAMYDRIRKDFNRRTYL